MHVAGDTAPAVALLAQRPGELVRRFDHLLRLALRAQEPDPATAGDALPEGLEALLCALEEAAPRVSPAVLLSALGQIRTRARRSATRVFFPKGGNAKAHIVDDDRAPLPESVVERAVAVLTGEVLSRAAQGTPVEVAAVDTVLGGVTAPFTERTASRALVTLPRGSELPVPEGKTLRLFLHWMESATSGVTDLDLSVAMFDAAWIHVATCDYTNLRYKKKAAVHSGDLTSAPAPDGASEFVDLDLARLSAAGVRYLVAVVFSYNSVPFVSLAEAFAGLMARDEPGSKGPVFQPRAVEQRFDLAGDARACVPLVIDVAGRTMRWLDVVKGVTGSYHSVAQHSNALADLGSSLTGLFASGARVTMGELATWQAAARAHIVVARHPDGTTSTYQRRDGEDAAGFAARIGTPFTDPVDVPEETRPALAYLMRGDITVAKDGEVFALYPAGLHVGGVRLLTASDVVGSLAPDPLPQRA